MNGPEYSSGTTASSTATTTATAATTMTDGAIVAYLRRILDAARVLVDDSDCESDAGGGGDDGDAMEWERSTPRQHRQQQRRGGGDDDDGDDEPDNDRTTSSLSAAGELVNDIARTLLRACDLDMLAKPTSNLPPPESFYRRSNRSSIDNDDDVTEERRNDGDAKDSGVQVNFDDDVDDDELLDGVKLRVDSESDIVPYQWRRTDYVRRVLRAMAPIGIDVAARVAETVVASAAVAGRSREGGDVDHRGIQEHGIRLQQQQQQEAAAFVLFSVWLPVAPHIEPLVTQLLSLPHFQFPLHLSTMPNDEEHATNARTLPYHRFLLVEASFAVCSFYSRQRQHSSLTSFWNWSPVLRCLEEFGDNSDETMSTTNDGHSADPPWLCDAIRWYAVRTAALALNISSARKADYYAKYGVQDEVNDEEGETREVRLPPWNMHPFELDFEETIQQSLHTRQPQPCTRLWDYDEVIPVPAADQIRTMISLHPYLLEISPGLIFVKRRILFRSTTSHLRHARNSAIKTTPASVPPANAPRLIRTETTRRNLSLIGTAMCIDINPPPILVCGPRGSGKSSLIRELARLFHSSNINTVSGSPEDEINDSLVEIHVDDETDSKTLIGSYVTTEIPGQFEWRPGALTQAVRAGQWVLLEDIDRVPVELQASLVQLLENRVLPIGSNLEPCNPNFRLFGTLTTSTNSEMIARAGKMSPRLSDAQLSRVLYPHLWTTVHVQPLPLSEIRDIVMGLYPNHLPESIVNATLAVFEAIDSQSGRFRADEGARNDKDMRGTDPLSAIQLLRKPLWIGRHASVRDLFKVFCRMNNGLTFEPGSEYITESQRTLCLAEAVDVFVAASPDEGIRRQFVQSVVSVAYGVSAELALQYVEKRRPTFHQHGTIIEIGRAKIPVSRRLDIPAAPTSSPGNFAATEHTLRLMEAIGVCIQENEPTLLVGETGCGKTTILQHMAKLSGRELVVLNLSLQTDSTDLLGGYRPLEMQFIATRVYRIFVDLFVSTFSRKQNIEFLGFASSMLKKSQWKKLSQCFRRAAQMGLAKVHERKESGSDNNSPLAKWERFNETAELFEQQRRACDSGMAFVFTEGALVEAVREGKWVLLDEINLASSETLQRLCGLLDDRNSSLTLTERGDATAIKRHPEFRLLAAMNPATDAGKKDLNDSVRARFTELFVGDILDPAELRIIAGKYISSVLPVGEKLPEHTDTVIDLVGLYLKCRRLAESALSDAGGQRPRYTLRTLTRALTAARTMVLEQKLPLQRAIFEGFGLAFQGPLDQTSTIILRKTLHSQMKSSLSKSELDQPGRQPGGRRNSDSYVLIKPFWIKTGSLDPVDWSNVATDEENKRFVLIPTAMSNLRRLARVVAAGPWPVLLEGPTSAGKTSLVEYLAARCGHHVIRINNHEHTDVQEYTGGFASDSNGSLSFKDGLLVHALRRGYWVILDELNLAPTEVLEALNRLLDDNRELYLPETNETVKPHQNFRLFATQNPSGAYGGRKPLSRAFRNRFVEMHVGDIPCSEAATILEKRCSCPPSHAKVLVDIMETLRQRRSRSGLFLGKDGFITPRDLLRWAQRGASSKVELAQEGYMLLAERLRTAKEKACVQEVLESQLKVKIDIEALYFGESSESRGLLDRARRSPSSDMSGVETIAPTRSILRLVALVLRCIRKKEPVLLVGGKSLA